MSSAMYNNNESAIIDPSGAQYELPALSENLEFWMTRLPPKLKALPIIQLAIPGSHNTMTYTIEKNNDIGPDEPVPIRNIGRRLSIVIKPIIFNWSINQEENVKDQLDGGIRYLDLRVATKPGDNNIYFLHGLYGDNISQPLHIVNEWLNQHPNEVIIVDFQHFYNFDEANHRSLINQIKFIFRGKMCPVYNKFDNITLQWLSLQKYQVFVVYRNAIAQYYTDLWPGGLWPTPWPETVDSTKLVNFLNNGLQKRSRDAGYVSQCLLTPTKTYVTKHICGNLRRNLTPVCRSVTMPWVEQHSPGNGGMNIVITDFVTYDNFSFSRKVIQRNETLLQS
ncbi:PI-PLC X domain-containing protein 3 [Phymastichus coffea]|uniref:PI-PLC X domain-containing protein 3 n=1 Tax=Phymastichus coffea TaxID=108790 RepID=UPI00273CBFA1|nr:PI-PLC X domain-containing protein 3 [Phymastichus coffea]